MPVSHIGGEGDEPLPGFYSALLELRVGLDSAA